MDTGKTILGDSFNRNKSDQLEKEREPSNSEEEEREVEQGMEEVTRPTKSKEKGEPTAENITKIAQPELYYRKDDLFLTLISSVFEMLETSWNSRDEGQKTKQQSYKPEQTLSEREELSQYDQEEDQELGRP